jgi:hypothetical protein
MDSGSVSRDVLISKEGETKPKAKMMSVIPSRLRFAGMSVLHVLCAAHEP